MKKFQKKSYARGHRLFKVLFFFHTQQQDVFHKHLVYTNLVAKSLIKMPLENRVDPVVLRERGGKIMMIMMVAVARYFDGSWLASEAKILRNFPYLTSSGLPRQSFDTLVTKVDTLVIFLVCMYCFFTHYYLKVRQFQKEILVSINLS